MRLKSLEMQGFKSFPDKTVINFDRGITIVVGPNGSGKSNISDAMRWVLGEISSKNIRGTKMEDVIFAGSQKRSPMGFAEVSVTFDNSEEDGRIVSMADHDEITVTRRYYRAGESEYFINKKPVRLKDIHELFMNTGLGRGGYSIIGQGRISEIISSKSEDRRAVFEEAAGIAKYRFQKEEAERKLAQTLDNLVRLEDIESELEVRVGPLEKEAAKAKKYLEIRDEKKSVDVALSVYDTDIAGTEADELEKKLASGKRDLEAADEALGDLERKSDSLFEQANENKASGERMAEEVSSLTEKIYECESEKKLAENDMEHLRGQLDSSKALLEEKRGALERLGDEKEKRGESLKKAKSRCDELSASRGKCEDDVRKGENDAAALKAKEDSVSASYDDAKTAENDAKVDLAAIISRRESDAKKRDGLLAEIAKYDEDIGMLALRIGQAQEKIAGYDEKLKASSKVTDETGKRKAECEQTARNLAEQKNSLFLEISQRKHKAANLLRMEELFEGYSRAVRFIMTEYKQGSVRDRDGKIPKIYGPVSQFISVPEKYSAALEVALGQALQNIIVEDEECAKTAIEFLKKRSAGRATFYPLTTVHGTPIDGTSLGIDGMAGYVAVANTLVGCEDKMRGVVDYLSGRIIVAESMDTASRIARKVDFRYKVVTLDGQVINAGGSYTGGSLSGDTQMLSRRAQIDRLGEEIKTLEKESADTERAIDKNEKTLEKIKSDEKIAMGSYSMIKTLADAEKTQMQILRSNSDVLSSTRDELSKQLEALAETIKKSVTDERSGDDKISGYEKRIATAEKELCDIRREREKIAESLDSKKSRLSDISIELAREEKNAEMLASELDECEAKIVSTENEINSLLTLCGDIENKITENEKKAEECGKIADETRAEIEKTSELRAKLSEQSLEIERKMTETRNRQKELSHTRDLTYRDVTGLDAAYKRACEKQDKLTSFLWEEYEMTYSDACAAISEKITEKTRSAAVERQNKLKNAMKSLGDVHIGAIDEYREVKERYDTLSAQTKDLRDSKEELYKIVASLEETMKEDFSSTFEQINHNFGKVFSELFGGGKAELRLTDSVDVLSSGIEINVAPPGKVIKNMSLLSGGEQSFVAIALYFAILKVTPSPFCILDEIEAALDDVNVDRFADYVKGYSDKTQFVIITHRRGTMEAGDRIYGVTMHEKGISDVLMIDISEIEARTGEKPE